MTIADPGNIGEFVGAFAVLITLIYLALQVRANNDIARITSHCDVIAQFNAWYKEMEDPSLVAVVNRGAQDFDQLPVEEQLRFDTSLHHFMHICEQALYMGRGKYIPSGAYDGFIRGAVAFTSHGASKWWKDAQLTFSPDFVDVVEKARKENPDMPPVRELFPTFIFLHQSESNDS